MKQKLLPLALMLFSFTAFSQTDSVAIRELQHKVGSLQAETQQLQTEMKSQKTDFSTKLNAATGEISALQMQVEENRRITGQLADTLGIQIADTRTSANTQITEVKSHTDTALLWVIIGLLAAMIVSGVLYLLLHKKQKAVKSDLIAQLSETKQQIDETLVSEFAKHAEALETLSQMQAASQSSAKTAEPDHSLALKVASEINLIERNINLMDEKTKGLKQLNRSVEKLKDNLAANGYEIPQLLGKEFNQGMKVVVASSIPDENLEKGEEKITKILIPQVNYNGVMIQTAQIEVSVG
ncbi:MAG: hypothetical protein LBU90_05805 [Bacteroidales bacterium]|jgi:hypothetical protein|nr:hypothetical protein [Bacteroidales bacterium]